MSVSRDHIIIKGLRLHGDVVTVALHRSAEGHAWQWPVVHGLGTEVLHPTTLHEWYHFGQGNDTNRNRGVPNDLLGVNYGIWAIFKMVTFKKNDENNKRSIYDCYWSIFCIIIVLSRFRELYKSE